MSSIGSTWQESVPTVILIIPSVNTKERKSYQYLLSLQSLLQFPISTYYLHRSPGFPRDVFMAQAGSTRLVFDVASWLIISRKSTVIVISVQFTK